MRAALLLFACTVTAQAQWQLLDAHTTADLRGVDNVGKGVVWASGTHGTVLRSENNGTTWQHCPTPPDADKLDFRGIQAFDAKTAIVMSSGKGDLSRLYKTLDSCQTWKLFAKNPDKEGFWDVLRALGPDELEVAGDSVDHMLVSEKRGHVLPVWTLHGEDDLTENFTDHFFELTADPQEGGFAASNSTLVLGTRPHVNPIWSYQWLATGDENHSYVHREATEETMTCEPCRKQSLRVETPMSQGAPSAGIFSLSFHDDQVGIAVGGDYQKPDATAKTAAFSNDSGKSWGLAHVPPHGYRSAVAYDAATKTWITVGPNGTDISTDDGRNWRALKPGPGDAPDADQHWNALSLPFVVGPKGRIGMLEPGALQAAAK
jgi:photosystem II stability/assembly factor-like uncharacterized protein